MIAITVNKISTPCIPPHLLLSIFSFLWENVKPYTKGTIFVSPPFIMAKGVIHMAKIVAKQSVIHTYELLELSAEEMLVIEHALQEYIFTHEGTFSPQHGRAMIAKGIRRIIGNELRARNEK
jgi:hypothetical protein